MSVSASYGNHPFIFVHLPKELLLCSESKNSRVVRIHFERQKVCNSSNFSSSSSSIFPTKPSKRLKFLVKAASASSYPPPSGDGSEYSGQFLGAKPRRKSQRIAEIDQEEIDDPTLIADSDSCFCEVNGVQIHHKICDDDSSTQKNLEVSSSKSSNFITRVNFPMILLHGFGASVFSWNRVMKPLSCMARSKVVAFDRPAFGLTSRVNADKNSNLNPYSMIFSVLATLHFVDLLETDKAVLVGHSAGALVAVDTYFEAPERVAALILVAPAIFAPFSMRNGVKENQSGTDNRIKSNNSDSKTRKNSFLGFFSSLSKFTKYIVMAIVNVVKGMVDMISSLYKKALTAILRSTFGVMTIRMIINKFGVSAIRAAWYDSNQVSDHVLRGYTKPLKIKSWDKALVEYTVAMLTDSSSKLKSPRAKRLSDISCPVLIVTGDTDRLVPSWNSERLSRAIPGSCLEIIKNCGHLPQEEKPEEFVSIVDKFLQRVFGAAQEQYLQALT